MARILVSMPDEFLKSIDKLADTEHRSRSELVREALRSYLKKNSVSNPIKANANAKKLDELLN